MRTGKQIQKTLEEAIIDLYVNLKIQENVFKIKLKNLD